MNAAEKQIELVFFNHVYAQSGWPDMNTTKCESTKMVKLVEISPEGVTK
tara:strand:+ start:92 stop:238 length:147 start_codon:yes stop_codon:yes gene_type:complete